MFTRIKTAALLCLTMLIASSALASIPRNTFSRDQLLSSVENVTEKTDPPCENRVGDFSDLTPVRTGLFTVQAYGMPWVVQGTVYKTASGRFILFFIDPYGLCADSASGFSQWVDNAAWAASEWKTGIGEALYNLPANTWNTIRHPIQTVKNIPAGLSSAWDTMKSGDYGATGRLMGNITGNVEVGLAVGGAVKAFKAPRSTDLYRAVMPDELMDIKNTGQFINRGFAEGKYFTSSMDDAANYARQAVNAFDDPPYTIIKTQVPNNFLPTPVNVDGGIPAFVVPNSTLPSLTPTVMPTMPIPSP